MAVTEAVIRELLKGVAVIVFNKVTNDSIRFMICTQNLKLIPQWAHPKGYPMNRNPDIIRVYSFDTGDWRSFYKDEVLIARKYERKT